MGSRACAFTGCPSCVGGVKRQLLHLTEDEGVEAAAAFEDSTSATSSTLPPSSSLSISTTRRFTGSVRRRRGKLKPETPMGRGIWSRSEKSTKSSVPRSRADGPDRGHGEVAGEGASGPGVERDVELVERELGRLLLELGRRLLLLGRRRLLHLDLRRFPAARSTPAASRRSRSTAGTSTSPSIWASAISTKSVTAKRTPASDAARQLVAGLGEGRKVRTSIVSRSRVVGRVDETLIFLAPELLTSLHTSEKTPWSARTSAWMITGSSSLVEQLRERAPRRPRHRPPCRRRRPCCPARWR